MQLTQPHYMIDIQRINSPCLRGVRGVKTPINKAVYLYQHVINFVGYVLNVTKR